METTEECYTCKATEGTAKADKKATKTIFAGVYHKGEQQHHSFICTLWQQKYSMWPGSYDLHGVSQAHANLWWEKEYSRHESGTNQPLTTASNTWSTRGISVCPGICKNLGTSLLEADVEEDHYSTTETDHKSQAEEEYLPEDWPASEDEDGDLIPNLCMAYALRPY